MTLSKKDLDHVLDLAHLQVDEVQKEQYLDQLHKILNYMEKLNELDLTKITPNNDLSKYPMPLREDKVLNYDKIDLSLNSKSIIDNSFYVPQILGESVPTP